VSDLASASSRDTVVIDESVHSIYKQLTEGNDPVNAPFRTMKDVFLWAAILGFRSGTSQEIKGKRVIIFRWAQFSPQIDLPLLKAIAIADKGNIEVLGTPDELIEIIEHYANAGIHELSAKLLQDTGQPLWNLVEAISL
jgi:dnd system-associated protein 4